MKKLFARLFIVFCMMMTLLLALPVPVHAQSGTGNDKLIMGQSFTLESGQVQDGSLIIIGGTVSIKNGAQVNGDIFIAGGSLDLQGTAKGTVTAMGSVVNVGDTAVIEKDLAAVGGTVARSEKAVIKGRVDISSGDKIDFARPTDVIKSLPQSPILFNMDPIINLFGVMTRVLGLAALAAFVVLFFLKPVERVAETAVTRPMMAVLMGLLTFVVVPALMILLIITLILSPFGLLGLMVLGLAMLFGWISIGYEVGKRVAAALKVAWAAPVVAGLGVLLLSLVSELLNLNPMVACVGWVLPAAVSLLGLGAVVISRFGYDGQNHLTVPAPPSAPLPPSPPAPQHMVDSEMDENRPAI
jgi:hypothetical protein